MIRRTVIALPLVWVLAAQASAVEPGGRPSTVGERTPNEWLDLMNRAFAERSYDGVFSYFDGSDLSMLRVVHAVVDGVQRERLVHLNGDRREIVRNGTNVECIFEPDDEILELESSIPAGPFARAFGRSLDQIAGNYEMSLHGYDRVADRRTVRIAVTPRDDDRYGYRLWLDADNALLLRSELIDAKGSRLEIFQFASVRIDEPVDVAALEPGATDDAVRSHLTLAEDGAAAADEAIPWRAAWVPDGFVMAARDLRRIPSAQKPVETLMYSDGLAAFSVFIEAMPPAGAGMLVSRQGATVAVTNLIEGPESARYLVTVVGEVPVATAQRIARSVRHADAAR